MTAYYRDPKSPGSEAGLAIAGNVVRMHGNKDNYFMSDERGNTINGPMSIVAGSAQMRFGGLWTMNSELMLSLPSTLATPTPVMLINPPMAQISGWAQQAVVMLGLIGAFQGLSGL